MLVISVENKLMRTTTYPVDQLSHHARPRAVGFRCPIQAIVHQFDAEVELEDTSQLSQHVHTKTLILLVPLKLLVIHLSHHVWVLLHTQTHTFLYLVQVHGPITFILLYWMKILHSKLYMFFFFIILLSQFHN